MDPFEPNLLAMLAYAGLCALLTVVTFTLGIALGTWLAMGL